VTDYSNFFLARMYSEFDGNYTYVQIFLQHDLNRTELNSRYVRRFTERDSSVFEDSHFLV